MVTLLVTTFVIDHKVYRDRLYRDSLTSLMVDTRMPYPRKLENDNEKKKGKSKHKESRETNITGTKKKVAG
uniref:Uncharacterized protein n=1 Tax=Nelumbo nucifera TaxID=4432 RepID=A0A822Y6Q9_NELNU|nr:TPA_asm: hypothetical protein HUJ06_028497 [Nelumbo nucifera]